VTYLTSRSLYKRRSYRYEWLLLEHLKPMSLDVCTVYTRERAVYVSLHSRMNLSKEGEGDCERYTGSRIVEETPRNLGEDRREKKEKNNSGSLS